MTMSLKQRKLTFEPRITLKNVTADLTTNHDAETNTSRAEKIKNVQLQRIHQIINGQLHQHSLLVTTLNFYLHISFFAY